MQDVAHSSAEQAARALGEVLDDHAELRDVVVQLREAEDSDILNGLLQRLDGLLAAHFAREEADPNLQRMLALPAGPSPEAATRLIDEHRALLSTLADLIARVHAEGKASFAAVVREVEAFLERLQRHDARETELLAPTIDSARDAPSSPVLRSGALDVNLRRTAVDVVIPAEQAVLLEIVADRHGVHANTQNLLREINHRYAGWPQTLEDLHRRSMSDFAYYVADERAAEAIEVFFRLYARVVERALDSSLRETAIRRWFHYLEKVASDSGDRLLQLRPAFEWALVRLESIFRDDPRLASVASTRLRRFAVQLLASAPDPEGALVERTLALLASTLRQLYRQWLALPDPADWWRERNGAAAALPEPLVEITHTHLRQSLERLEHMVRAQRRLAERAADLLDFPDAARIERCYLDATSGIDSQTGEPGQDSIERVHWLIRLLSIEALEAVYPQALAEIHHACHDALAGADPASFRRLIRETFAALRRSQLSSSVAALALVSKIGVEVVASGDSDRADVVIDELLDWDFPGPAFSGFTDEWQVRVDPAHLRAIRAFLAVVGENPDMARRLIAALVVHLKLGDVFVADTDLFQRDVSELMNSEIAPVYHQIKHLLKRFPVYFNEIGAEGELREVSSRIDEISARKDLLCHLLRKLCHVECNPRLIGLIDAIGGFWASGDATPLLPYLPASVYERLDVASEEYAELHRAFSGFLAQDGVARLAALAPPALERRLADVPGARDVDREKVRLLVRLRQLISGKYELKHDDLLDRLTATRSLGEAEVEVLRQNLAELRHEQALTQLLDVLERLKATILREERTEGVEDIYRKRHVAAGIPSMYGRYREEKFEAMGLSLRVESLAGALFEQMIASADLEYVTRERLRTTAGWLRLLLRAVRVDGCHGRGLAAGIAMLEQALSAERISVDQYINVFQIISRGMEQLVRIRFIDVYEGALDRILRRTLARRSPAGDSGSGEQEEILMASEGFLRDLMAQSFGLQPLDRLVGETLRNLVTARESFDQDTLELLLSFDSDRCCVPIEAREGPLDGAVFLGNKGFQIQVLARYGLPIPHGFILTTEIFRCQAAIRSCAPLRQVVSERIRGEITRLERETGTQFGSPRRPLLLSVRSGAAVSMPGMLDTFLNVGISESTVEGLAAHSGSRWGAWDSYRRFVQLWGMGHGIDRDSFDAMMRAFKSELGVAKKADLPSEAMQELALRYRGFVEDHGVKISEDPFAQVERCVDLVLRSWDSEKARVYRAELQIAEEWGTAVVIQRMVYGNLSARSGTGVALTCDPLSPSRDVVLHGDFVVQGQGDDVVSGLVHTLPISEKQRVGASLAGALSLEKDFPRIYRALLAHARKLIRDRGMFHQEIEFTFESDDPADLYILQMRDSVMAAVSSAAVFVADEGLERTRLATGIGAGGGALSGRVAHTAEDIESLRGRFPEDQIVLLRPDTVPDDIPLILRADGMVTALGGATSHAALVAQQLGRTCVVGCRELVVDDERRQSTLGGRTLSSGDLVSINGIDGSVYLGKHAITTVRRHQLA